MRVNGADVVDAALCLMNMDASQRKSNGGQIYTSFLQLFYNKLLSRHRKLNILMHFTFERRSCEERREEEA